MISKVHTIVWGSVGGAAVGEEFESNLGSLQQVTLDYSYTCQRCFQTLVPDVACMNNILKEKIKNKYSSCLLAVA